MRRFTAYITFLVLLAISNEGLADFVERDSAFGNDTITVDNATGLEWLDVTQSTNMSVLEVESELLAGGRFFGYRLATAEELEVLFYSSGGLPPRGEETIEDAPLFFEMQRLFGLTTNWSHYENTKGITATASPYFEDKREIARISISFVDGEVSSVGSSIGSEITGVSVRSPNTGHWLVKGSFTNYSWIDCSVATQSIPTGVAVLGDFAYVSDSSSGLNVIDISDPTASQTVGIEYLSSTAMEVAVAGDFAYMAEYDLLSVVNISNPANPVQVGYVATAGFPTGVAVWGNYAFVANTYNFQVVDITDPTTPVLVGNIAPEIVSEYWASGVAISGSFAFVAGIEGLIVVDITNPEDPVLVRTLEFGGGAGEVVISGSIAYVCAGDLFAIDISDPVNPQVVGQVNTPGTALGVSIAGNLAYVGDSGSGLQIVDVSDPFNPQLLGGLAIPGWGSDLCVSGDFVYVGDGSYGLRVIQVSNGLILDCNSNDLLDVFEMADHPSWDWNNDGTLDICQQGLGVVDVPSETADRLILHDAWPNPFNPQTTIAFDLPRQTQATLRVYDQSGRLVRNLLVGATAKQGRNEFVWNGRDEAGRRVSSGVYYYVLDTGDFVDSKRMVLIK